ncbi:MAG: hypothetical protein DMF97_15045 [Acidobacteria bacterium]|nr:MAG: hypothetical protein DMF97_15045 [Acidobacteriota bacterium]
MSRAGSVAAALAIVGFSCLPVAAQGVYGVISGTVTDSSSAVLPGATVRVVNDGTQVTTTLTTNEAGVYNATNLIPGTYTVEASLSGFRTAVRKAVTLEVNASLKVDVTLQLGPTSESVTVIADAPLLETQQTNLGQTVTQRQIEQLPSGRNLFSLIPLAAGVSQQAACDNCGNNGNLRINGDRPRNQDYILDGTTITAPVFGGQAFNPAVDSIQEFKIETKCPRNMARQVAAFSLPSRRPARMRFAVPAISTTGTPGSTRAITLKTRASRRIPSTRTSMEARSAVRSSETSCSSSPITKG